MTGPPLILCFGFSAGFLGATAPHSMANSAIPNAVLNSLNSSLSPLQTPSPSNPAPSPSLWPSSLAGTQSSYPIFEESIFSVYFLPLLLDRFYLFPTGFSSQLIVHPATQATLSTILLSGVQGYTHSTTSPPPGLAPIDKPPNGVPDCALNGHVKVGLLCLLPFIVLFFLILDCILLPDWLSFCLLFKSYQICINL